MNKLHFIFYVFININKVYYLNIVYAQEQYKLQIT